MDYMEWNAMQSVNAAGGSMDMDKRIKQMSHEEALAHCESKPQSPISAEIDGLHKSVNRINKRVSVIESRLKPVLSEQTSAIHDDSPAKEQPVCELQDALRSLTVGVDTISAQLQGIIDRLVL